MTEGSSPTPSERQAFAEIAARVSGYNIAGRVIGAIGMTGGRHLLVLVAGIVIARGLGPVQFGNYMFLLAGFTTLHTLLDLSSSQGFYTLICQKTWPLRMYALYGGWVAAQLLLPLATIGLLLPDGWIRDIWRGQGREIVLLAFCASFAQRVFWQTVMQIYEASRLTIRVQFATVAIMAAHLVLVVLLNMAGLLSVTVLFIAVALEFALGGLFMLFVHRRRDTKLLAQESAREMLRELVWYVIPLVPSLLLASINSFGETWLLQIFGGAEQQAFFNVAQQYANIGLVFGFSANNVFWKEIAAAHARDDNADMRRIYLGSTRVLFLLPALVAAFGFFWSDLIIKILLGAPYAQAAPVFSLTLLTSIFQCMGIVTTVMFVATGRGRAYSMWIAAFVLVSVMGSVIFVWILRMGAYGLALKLMLVIASFTLMYDWYICRLYGWKTDNLYRGAVLAVLFSIGWASHALVLRALGGHAMLTQVAAGLTAYGLITLPLVVYLAHRIGYLARLRRLIKLAV